MLGQPHATGCVRCLLSRYHKSTPHRAARARARHTYTDYERNECGVAFFDSALQGRMCACAVDALARSSRLGSDQGYSSMCPCVRSISVR